MNKLSLVTGRASLPLLSCKRLSHDAPDSPTAESPYKIKKGTFTIFTEKSKVERELRRYEKYGIQNMGSNYNSLTQKEAFNKLMEKFREKSFKNAQPHLKLSSKINGISKREPTLEAVLNDFSRARLKLPTIQTSVRKSVGALMKDLPEQDKFSKLKNFHKIQRYQSKSSNLIIIGPHSDNSSDLNDDIQK